MSIVSSPSEDGAVITDAVPLDIVPGDDQEMVEDGVLSGGAELDEGEEVAGDEGEDNVVDDDGEEVAGEEGEDNVVDDGEEVAGEEEEDNVVDDDENEGNLVTEEGDGNNLSDSFEDVDESDEEEVRIAVEEGGDTVYFDDDDDEEEEDFIMDPVCDDDVSDDDDEDEEVDDDAFMDEDGEDEVKKNNGLLEVDDAGGSVGEESGKKEDEEKVGGRRLKKKFAKVVVKRFVENSSDEAKGKKDRDGEKSRAEEEKGKGKVKVEIGEKGKGVHKRLGLRKGDKQKVAPAPTDKSGSKLKEKAHPKRVESMGMVFMCSSKTKQDCYQYKVLGLPAGKRDVVERIYKGMRLFLYDVDLKLMYGIYKATAPGGYNLEPKAFNSKFPSQVRFTVLEDCIPLAEENFRKVLKDNYFSKKKFDTQLTHEQVKNLCKLFVVSSKVPNSRRLEARPKTKAMCAPTSMRRDRPGPPRAVDGGRKRDRPRAPPANEGRQRKRTRPVDGGRARGPTNERRPQNGYSNVVPVVDTYRQRNYLHLHQREVVAPPLSVLPPPYAYERTLERDAYRPAVLVEHRVPYREPLVVARDVYDPYRQHSLPDYRDAYRQDPIVDYRDAYRRDRVSQHRDLQTVSVEPRRYEPYSYYSSSYRDRESSYRNPVYGEIRLPVEPDRFRSYNRTDYRSGGSPAPEYHPTRGLHHRY